jgi:DNA excision repair protein ERCC-3
MTNCDPQNPLIVQSDHTVLVEVHGPHYEAARNELLRFAELIKSPEHIHTYRISPLSIWNACAAGVPVKAIIATLIGFAKYPVPEHVLKSIEDFASRYGKVRLEKDRNGLTFTADDDALAAQLYHSDKVRPLLAIRLSTRVFRIKPVNRGKIKQALIKVGYPADDMAGYTTGEPLALDLRPVTRSGVPFRLRPYQRQAAQNYYAGGATRGGSGVIVLPCGAGKTIVGIACMAELATATLILTTGVTAIRQWKAELMDKTNLNADQIGEYSGQVKEIRPVVLSTYQTMTYRPDKTADFPHLALFNQRNWGLIIYDEVHMLPAPVFQVTAGLQARRRLGLTATLVREDGKEDDVFALIGPKKADMPWKELEAQGWIAKARCHEIRLPLPDDLRMPYALAGRRQKYRLAAENPAKLKVVQKLLKVHVQRQTLLIGMYVDQIKAVAGSLQIPVITGSTPQPKRDNLYRRFKNGEFRVLAVSKVANFAVDLPDASVAIQISGTFGSRQEEAQRLGRILRPKAGENQAFFYSLVSQDTLEQEFALNRQLFLCEQGYEYVIEQV